MPIVSCFSLGEAHLEADVEPRSLCSVGNKLSRDVYVVWSLGVDQPNGDRIDEPKQSFSFHVASIRKELSDMSFEQLLQLKEELGTKVYNEAIFGESSMKNNNFKRANKNR
uniref:Uncharacterized protein n=1 Tax=Timema douglasi TaxID=61478 RepID=A0A7R8Z9W2_TIMDO|nr:unnamed protein product [Timema douglasi]